MNRGGCFGGFGDGGIGRTLRRVLMTQADRRDRLPILQRLPDRSPAAPDATVDDQLTVR